MQIIFIYYVSINILTYLIYFLDKYKAVKQYYRTPERTLIILAFLGGALGAYLSMHIHHHKTLKWKFRILVPIAILLHLVILIYLFMQNSVAIPFLYTTMRTVKGGSLCQ
ncbi:MAG: DUF1294 domain-containing protein [Erysipelotrichaceae bacterium]|nr:DUF1294 domain-containing protein [Erysipelotrichaceae bacterium]